MTFIYFLVFVACVAYDFYITRKRIAAYGEQVELNSFTKWCVRHMGTTRGLIVSHVPFVLLAAAICVLGWRQLMAFWTGYRVCLAHMQVLSEAFVKEAEDFFKHL